MKSKQEWYSIEIGDLPSYPKVLAVPYGILKEQTVEVLPYLLKEKIQFKDMLPETLIALSRYAIDRDYDKVFSKTAKELLHFKINDRSDPFIIADKIERDFYYLGTNDHVSRIDMVILSTFDSVILDRDKAKKRKGREAIRKWEIFRDKPDGRSDTRRFTGEGWSIEDGFLHRISSNV